MGGHSGPDYVIHGSLQGSVFCLVLDERRSVGEHTKPNSAHHGPLRGLVFYLVPDRGRFVPQGDHCVRFACCCQRSSVWTRLLGGAGELHPGGVGCYFRISLPSLAGLQSGESVL